METEFALGGLGVLGAGRADALAGKNWCSEGSRGAQKTAAIDFPTLMWDRELALQNVGAAWVGGALLSTVEEPASRRK